MTWTAADGKLLKDLRTAAGLDRATLARRCTISTGQLTELEDGGTGRFYSESIKAHTGRTVLAKLGHVRAVTAPTLQEAPVEPPPAQTQDLWVPVPEPETQLDSAPPAAPNDAPAAARGPEERTWLWIGGLVAVSAAIGIALWIRGPGTTSSTATAALPASVTAQADPAPAEPPAPPPAAAPVSEPAAAAAPERAVSVAINADCNLPTGITPVAFTPERALKPSSYVYLEASEAVQVCAVDARQRRLGATVTPADGVTLSGTPPFTVHTTRWSSLRVYFQGVRVPLDDPGLQGGSLLLQPAP